MSPTELEATLNTVPFLATLGVRVEEARPGRVILRLPSAPRNTNHAGALHTGALFAVAETAAAVALATHPDLSELRHLQTGSRATWIHSVRADATAHASITSEQAEAIRATLEHEREARTEVLVQVLDGHGRDIAEIRSAFRFKRAR